MTMERKIETAPPEPLVSAEVDISKLDGFMLDTRRVLSSELMALSTGEEFKAAFTLWCRAWQQQPAASLPNNPRILASFAGVSPQRWQKIKEMALRGFVLCSDGRLYHRVLAQDANRAWEALKKRHDRTKAATDARKKGRYDDRHDPRDEARNDDRHEQRGDERNVDRDDLRNEVPTVARDGTGRDVTKEKKPPPTAGTTPRAPGDGAAAVAARFVSLRSELWPNESSLPAPTATLRTQAQQHLDAGGTVELLGEVIERGMRGWTKPTPPNSLKALANSLTDAVAGFRRARDGTPPPTRSRDAPAASGELVTRDQIDRTRLERFRETGNWLWTGDPAPTHPRCQISRRLMAEVLGEAFVAKHHGGAA